MRIVIDMQGAQRAQDDAVHQGSLGLVLALARMEAHELHLVMNSALPTRIAAIRAACAGLLPPGQLHCYDPLAPSAAQPAVELALPRAAAIAREYFIACLRPDVVLQTSLFEGYDDAAITSVSAFPMGALQAVLVHDGIFGAGSGGAPELQFMADKCAELREADLVLAWSGATAQSLCAMLELDADRLVLLGAVAPVTSPDWDVTARAVFAALSEARARAPLFAPGRKRRLAFVSPFPPERTGIADYAVQLLPALLAHFDIELVAHQSTVELPAELAGMRVREAAWFADNAHLYDQILYQFGNSAFHSHMFALLQDHPGVVVLHDFYLSNVLAYEQMTGDTPNAWAKALLLSHGYDALRASQVEGNHDGAMRAYPCNLEVLEAATGVIVHSEHAADLARQWYGPGATANWTVVPLPRSAPVAHDRLGARAALGIAPDAFVVCSFGYIAPGKQSHALVQAWIASSLHTDPECVLILVGANHSGQYGTEITEMIDAAGAGSGIRIAGWTDETAYHQYLQAADAGVQLRTSSRGETSAAVLDCLNYGLPTIVNANGSMAALPADSVFQLPDDFAPEALVRALEILRSDTGRRIALGVQAAALLETTHRPETCAVLYHAALDRALHAGRSGEAAMLQSLAELPGLLDDDATVRQLAVNLARAPGVLVQRQLLVDVTAIAQHDLMTGIERVVRTQLLELLRLQLPGVRVEPVYLSTEGNRWHYRYARNYAGRLLGIVWGGQIDQVVDVHAGDIFYSADYSAAAVSEAARAGVYAELRVRGVTLNFLVHDLLPVLRPEFFPSNSAQVHARWLNVIGAEADQLIAISAAVRQELSAWYDQHPPVRERQLTFGVLHHGADISHPVVSAGNDAAAWPVLAQLGAHPTFLMVGTIEPRKGHLQTIAAFEELWCRGVDAQLVIVGTEGWKGLPENERRTIPDIVSRLGRHGELGKRLFWLQGIDDDYLQQIYTASVCLLSPSEGEGFGLPLIEAARAGIYVIARDIPVFREVAQQGAYYFSGLDPANLADAIETWLALHAQGNVPAPAAMAWSTWSDNVRALLPLLDPAMGVEAGRAPPST